MSHSFVHLHLHSEYSVQEGLLRIPEIMSAATAQCMPAVALTDLCNGFGWVKFYRAAMAAGVKPLLGVQLWLDHDGLLSRFEVLCLNNEGYSHLKKLISTAYQHRSSETVQVTVSWEQLVEHQAGLLILSGGLQGDIALMLASSDTVDQARACCQRWQSVFGQRFYLELQRIGHPQEETVIRHALMWSHEFHIPVVATSAVCFLSSADYQAHEARVCIHQGEVLDDPKRSQQYTPEQHFKSHDDMVELFIDIPEAIENTWHVAQRCTVELEMGVVHLPNFPLPNDQKESTYLEAISQKNLIAYMDQQKFSTEEREQYQHRLDHELGVIVKMGFPGYFLIVADFIGWAKNNSVPVGPGRGSGAGSLVAFVLKITTLDPLLHELLFERFLNPERVSMPDFDIDFCMDKRDKVIEYVVERYGQDAVAQIITYGTMAAKAVVRDVGRVMGMPYGFVDKLAKLIPFELGMTLKLAMDQEERLKKRYDEESEVQSLIDLAMRLEGLTRHAGRHAGGVVIAPRALHHFVPLYRELNDHHQVTQFDKDDLETVGLVKFDFLGLRTLTIIQWTLDQVNANRAADDRVDIDRIPLDDSKTFAMLKDCATTAVFQLESRGMRDLVRRLQPDCFDDLVALVALFRPGPLQSGMVDDFVDRKHGRAEVFYAHPTLETILRPTYGVILYQEQVMQIAQVMGGYTLGHADILRRAMGKKKPEEMARQSQIFVNGAVENGVPEKIAQDIFDLMEKFSGYGFNKSHSAAYACISYQTAWLKAHFPEEFMSAVLSSDMDNTDKVVGFVRACQDMSLTVVFPNIQTSCYYFSVNEARHIIYGLGAIKGVGQAAIESIMESRRDGSFEDFYDFCQRVDLRKVNRRVLDALISSGACDCFGETRATCQASIDKVLKLVEQYHKNQQSGQGDLFSSGSVEAADQCDWRVGDVLPWTDRVRLAAEKDTLGLYLSGHPLNGYAHELKHIITDGLQDVLDQKNKKESVIVAGYLVNKRLLTTRRGQQMAILTLEDQTAQMDVTVFHDVYHAVIDMLDQPSVWLVDGRARTDAFNGRQQVVADRMQQLDVWRMVKAKKVSVSWDVVTQVGASLDVLLSGILGPFRGGDCRVCVMYRGIDDTAEMELGADWSVSLKPQLLEHLQQVFGMEKVAVHY